MPGKTLFALEEAAATRHRHSVPALRRRAEGHVAEAQAAPDRRARRSTSRTASAIVYSDQTGVVPPKDIDVILVAPEGLGHHGPPAVPRRQGHQRQLRHPPGRHRPGARSLPGPGHRHRLGLPVRDDLPEGSLQRPDRRARRAHGRDLRPVAGPVRSAARARPFAVARRSTRRSRKRRRASTR